MNHALLIACLVIGHEAWLVERELLESLTNTCHVAVTEDAEGTRNGALTVVTVNGELVSQELNECLANSHATRSHGCLSIFLLLSRVGKSGVDLLTVPGLADPRVGGVVTDLPDPVRVWSSHDVQVVEVIPGCCHAGAVPSVGN